MEVRNRSLFWTNKNKRKQHAIRKAANARKHAAKFPKKASLLPT